jgi:putative ABC transport system ATP-binding protein
LSTRADSGPALLDVIDLTAWRERRAVGVLPRLRLRASEAVLLLGPSGSGKTSLMLAMAGLAPATGQMWLGGRDVMGLTPKARAAFRGTRIGSIFQDLHLVAGLTVLDNLLLAPFAIGEVQDRERALDLLSQMGLAHKARQRAETLSRGEAQRVAIARAMLLRPSLILADEPTASLDDANCEVVAELLLRAAAQASAALVIATHDHRLKARTPYHIRLDAAETVA